jgi:hypothetical protein
MPLVLHLQVTFVQNPFSNATYTGLLQGGSYAQSGYVRVTLLSTGSFSALFNLGQQTSTLKNSFTLPSTSGNPPQFASQLKLAGNIFNLTLALGSGGAITGSLSSTSDNSSLSFSATRPVAAPVPSAVAALAGSYGAAFTIPTPATGMPTGSGAVAVTVSKSGAIRFAGNLGDGLKVSLGGILDANGAYPFYLSTSASKTAGAELALGEISAVLGQKPVQFTGTLDWFRAANTNDPAYRAGFCTRLMVTADPAGSLSGLAPTAQIAFAGGDLKSSLAQGLNISRTGVATPASLPNGAFSLKYSKSTGLFTGSFMDLGQKRTFTGAFLPSDNKGFGYFQETGGLTGSVLLQTGP